MDLIDREALLKDLGGTIIFSGRTGCVSAEMRGARKVINRIKAAPAVEAEPEVHAHWIDIVPTSCGDHLLRCSHCHWTTYVVPYDDGGVEGEPYCHHCGAKMDEEEKHEAD